MVMAQRDREQLADLDKPVVDLIERFGFEWRFDYDYPTPDFEANRRVQVRDEKHLAPPSMVTLIRAAMARRDKLPSIVVTEDGVVVDGNTRAKAAKANKYPTIHAVVIDVVFDKASAAENRRLSALGAAFNARHGKGIDRAELMEAVKEIGSDPTYTGTRIAALIGVTESTVRSILAELRARERATALGLHVNGSISAAKLRTLGNSSEYLKDEPFKALYTLVDETGMAEPEIKALVKQAREAKSDTEAVDVIAKDRVARQPQIAEYKASGKSIPPAAAKLRQRLGFVLGFEANHHELMEHNASSVAEYINQMERAVVVLQKVIAEQKA